MSDWVRTTKGKTSQEPREISLVISFLIDGEDIPRFEPPVLGERLRCARFVIEITLRDTASLGPKFTMLSDATVRTVLTNNPGLQARHEKTN